MSRLSGKVAHHHLRLHLSVDIENSCGDEIEKKSGHCLILIGVPAAGIPLAL